MSESTASVLQYSRRWSRKDLKNITCISLNNSGSWLSAAEDSSLLIFHADNGALAVRIECLIAISAMLWVSDIVLVCCRRDGTIMTVSLLQKSILVVGTVCRGHQIEKMAISHGNTYLATGCGKDVRIWRRNALEGTWAGLQQLTSPPTSHANASTDVTITSLHWLESAAERTATLPSQLIVSYRNHGIQVWNVYSGQIVHTILNTSVPIGSTALSPDAKHLAVVMTGGIDMIDVPSRRQELLADPKCGLECPILFIHEGGVLLSRYERSAAQLWSLSGEELQAVLHSSVAQLNCIAAYSDDHAGLFRIATASSTKIALWQPANPCRLSVRDRASYMLGRLSGGAVFVCVAVSALVIVLIAMAAGRVTLV